jgi:hypothetical protein
VSTIVPIFQSVTIVGFTASFCIVVSIVKEAKNVKRSVAFQCVTVEEREKFFRSRSIVCYSNYNVMIKLNYNIQIHYEVAGN